MSAAITFLLHYGWSPIAPSRWHLPGDGCNNEGIERSLPGNQLTGAEDLADLLDDFTTSVQRALWRDAAMYYRGEGAAEGPPQSPADAPKGHAVTELMLATAVGGTWPRKRLMAEVQEADPQLRRRPRCYAVGDMNAEAPL
eukprot:4577593-Pyramimonas_sp.AAC.1